jgi:predicted glycoside hydrolase/deacetylase ChbG (UPF0249 family)
MDTGKQYLIVTADDYGAAININEGIRQAVGKGIITEISVLTNFNESIPGLKVISEGFPNIGIGVHLNITTGKPLTNPELIPTLINKNGNFSPVRSLLPHIGNISPEELKTELKAQVQVLLDNGIQPDHLSDHCGILTLCSPFFNILIDLAREFNLPVRSPVIASLKYPGVFTHAKTKKEGITVFGSFLLSNPIRAISCLSDFQFMQYDKKARKLDSSGIVHPDLLIDYFYGNPTTSNLDYILNNLPPGINEIILHLGNETRQQEYPNCLNLDYFRNRELELSTISQFDFNNRLQQLNIRKIGFSDIAALRQP